MYFILCNLKEDFIDVPLRIRYALLRVFCLFFRLPTYVVPQVAAL